MITVLMGAPGAGKSTWVKRHKTDEIVLSTEAIRVFKDDIDQGAYMAKLRQQGAQAIKENKSVIVDATNTFTHHRLYWLRLGKAHNQTTRLVIFNTALPLLIAAQDHRQHPASAHIVKQHHQRLQHSMIKARSEGWDQVQIINRNQYE